MPTENRDAAYIWDMLQAANEVVQMVSDSSLAAFLDNLMLMRATERNVELLGEAARRISPKFREDHPRIPWRKIIGQRNVLAHEYGRIDHEVLYRTAVEDIPELAESLRNLIRHIDS